MQNKRHLKSESHGDSDSDDDSDTDGVYGGANVVEREPVDELQVQ